MAELKKDNESQNFVLQPTYIEPVLVLDSFELIYPFFPLKNSIWESPTTSARDLHSGINFWKKFIIIPDMSVVTVINQ